MPEYSQRMPNSASNTALSSLTTSISATKMNCLSSTGMPSRDESFHASSPKTTLSCEKTVLQRYVSARIMASGLAPSAWSSLPLAEKGRVRYPARPCGAGWAVAVCSSSR